jgi:guanylate kinase
VSARLVVVSGPSGVGKGTLIRAALDRAAGVGLATSATTRPRRPGEAHGREYWFLAPDDFARRVEAGEVEVAGARAIKQLVPEAVLVFIAPPELDALAERLRSRGTNSEEEIADRLSIAEREMRSQDEFDHVITNDDADRAAAELVRLIEASQREGDGG